MTLDKLQNEGYNCSDYEDMELYCKVFEEGAPIYKYNNEFEVLEEGIIICAIRRSNNPDWYDKSDIDEFEEKLGEQAYSFSGEFILDDDCYYVFAK